MTSSSRDRPGAGAGNAGHRRHVVRSVADLADVRGSVRDWLAGTADRGRLEEILLVVSELGANAVEATPADRPPPVLHAHVDPRGLHLAMANHVGDPGDGVHPWDYADPVRAGGRGLLLIAAYADEVVITPDADAVTVECTFQDLASHA